MIYDGLLDGYLINFNVFVLILEYCFFFVNGQVMKFGSYFYYFGLMVNKVIIIVGGFIECVLKINLFIFSSDDLEVKLIKVILLSKF